MEAKLISLVNLWRDDRQERYLDSFYSHIKDYDDSKVSSVLKAVRRFLGGDEEGFVDFITIMSARHDGAIDAQIEGVFGLTPVGHGVSQSAAPPPQAQGKRRSSVFINERGLAYAKKTSEFDANMARGLAEKLMLEGYESVVLIAPSHLTKDQAEVFVGLVEGCLVEQGFPREDIYRSQTAFANTEDLVAHIEKCSNHPDKNTSTEKTDGYPQKPHTSDVEREDLTATGEKVYDALNGVEQAKLSEVLRLLDDAGVSLSLIDSGEGKRFLSFYDRELSMSLSGSKMCSDKSAFQFNGSYLSQKVDFNFDLNEFFVEVINLSADKLRVEGAPVRSDTINEKLKEMGYSFKVSGDGKTIENCFFRKADGKKFNLEQAFDFDVGVSPRNSANSLGQDGGSDYSRSNSSHDEPPVGYGDMPPQFDEPPVGYGDMPPQFDEPPVGYGDMPPQFDEPPVGYGDMPSQFDEPPVGYGDVPPQFDEPSVGYGDMPPQFDEPPVDYGDMPPQYDGDVAFNNVEVSKGNQDSGELEGEARSYSPFEKALVDAVVEEEKRMDEIYRDLQLPKEDPSSPSAKQSAKRHVNPF